MTISGNRFRPPPSRIAFEAGPQSGTSRAPRPGQRPRPPRPRPPRRRQRRRRQPLRPAGRGPAAAMLSRRPRSPPRGQFPVPGLAPRRRRPPERPRPPCSPRLPSSASAPAPAPRGGPPRRAPGPQSRSRTTPPAGVHLVKRGRYLPGRARAAPGTGPRPRTCPGSPRNRRRNVARPEPAEPGGQDVGLLADGSSPARAGARWTPSGTGAGGPGPGRRSRRNSAGPQAEQDLREELGELGLHRHPPGEPAALHRHPARETPPRPLYTRGYCSKPGETAGPGPPAGPGLPRPRPRRWAAAARAFRSRRVAATSRK